MWTPFISDSDKPMSTGIKQNCRYKYYVYTFSSVNTFGVYLRIINVVHYTERSDNRNLRQFYNVKRAICFHQWTFSLNISYTVSIPMITNNQASEHHKIKHSNNFHWLILPNRRPPPPTPPNPALILLKEVLLSIQNQRYVRIHNMRIK